MVLLGWVCDCLLPVLQATTVFPQHWVSRRRASAPHHPGQCLAHQRGMMLFPRQVRLVLVAAVL